MLKVKIAPEEQCKFYALLAMYLKMWDQVLTLAILLVGIKGLASEVERKILCLFIVLILILYEDCDLVIYFQFLTEPIRVEKS